MSDDATEVSVKNIPYHVSMLLVWIVLCLYGITLGTCRADTTPSRLGDIDRSLHDVKRAIDENTRAIKGLKP